MSLTEQLLNLQKQVQAGPKSFSGWSSKQPGNQAMRHSAPAKQLPQQHRSRTAVVPLEFKTGKRHQSHRAQARRL